MIEDTKYEAIYTNIQG